MYNQINAFDLYEVYTEYVKPALRKFAVYILKKASNILYDLSQKLRLLCRNVEGL